MSRAIGVQAAEWRIVGGRATDERASEVRFRLPLSSVPQLAVTAEDLRALPLDARGAYVLSLVDGHATVETIVDVCEMDREEVVALLAHLLEAGVIALRGG